MESLLAAVHAAASPRDWSRGVELSRAGAVVLVRQAADEIVVQVAVKGAAVSPTVTLWPADAEWSCDCDSRADPREDPIAHADLRALRRHEAAHLREQRGVRARAWGDRHGACVRHARRRRGRVDVLACVRGRREMR